jgi:hypothetical protein
MNKIFKYEITKNGGGLDVITAPEQRTTIRIDHVDDGFYKGDFLWAIVDTASENVTQPVTQLDYEYTNHLNWIKNTKQTHQFSRRELAVKEKQTINSGKPVFAEEDDGKLYVYCLLDGPIEERTICFYKTGQEIDMPVDELIYIGINRLWIVQELGLYTFVYEDENAL